MPVYEIKVLSTSVTLNPTGYWLVSISTDTGVYNGMDKVLPVAIYMALTMMPLGYAYTREDIQKARELMTR